MNTRSSPAYWRHASNNNNNNKVELCRPSTVCRIFLCLLGVVSLRLTFQQRLQIMMLRSRVNYLLSQLSPTWVNYYASDVTIRQETGYTLVSQLPRILILSSRLWVKCRPAGMWTSAGC